MIYTFQCQSCFWETHDTISVPIGAPYPAPCQQCGGLVRRRVSFSFRRSLAPHFNQSTGNYVSNERDFADQLKRKSEEATLRTGMEHNYVPVDVTDAKALGVTDDGLEVTKRVRRNLGLDPAPTTKVII